MRKIMLSLTAAAVALPALGTATPAEARHHYRHHHYGSYYRGRAYSRGYCRRRSGTTGLIVGGVGGGLLGHAIAGGTGGTLIGAGAGALLGRHIERHGLGYRCYR